MAEYEAEGVAQWRESTQNLTPAQKVLRAFEWSTRMAHQGENAGSAWDQAMQETLPILRRMVTGDG